MTINVRNKGANGEREVADILQKVVNEVALSCGYTAPRIRRNVEQTQIGGEDLVGLPWYSFEIKRVERVDLEKWWEQTCVQARRKAAGSTSWDSLAKGGWRRLGGGGEATAALGQGEGAAAGADGLQGTLGGAVKVDAEGLDGSRSGDAVAGSSVVLVPARSVAGPALASLPLPLWAGGSSMGGLMGALAKVDAGKPVQGLAGGLGGSREPVLVWRQNRQPWRVRCLLAVCIDGKTRLIVSDVTLDDWLDVFRDGLRARLKG